MSINYEEILQESERYIQDLLLQIHRLEEENEDLVTRIENYQLEILNLEGDEL